MAISDFFFQELIELTFPRSRSEVVESAVFAGILQGGRAEHHVADELVVAELVGAAPRIEDEPPAADFALSENEQSDLGGSGVLIRRAAFKLRQRNGNSGGVQEATRSNRNDSPQFGASTFFKRQVFFLFFCVVVVVVVSFRTLST